MVEITKKINDYVSIKVMDSGNPYDFMNKEGKHIKGVSKEQIKLVTPYTSVVLKPSEVLAIIACGKDAEFMAEVQRRAKA